MKYIVILGDGMAGEPIKELGDRTTLEYANTPTMNVLASQGEMGLTKTVPDFMSVGSDVANLSVLGYDPTKNYSGRSPLEALSVGVPMEESDIILRCNLVTLTEEMPYEEKTILDHSAGEISTEEADALMDAIRQRFNSETFQFYTGTSYRQIAVWKNGVLPSSMEPPHDHLGQKIGLYLPKEKLFRDLMKSSYDVLNDHPVNQKRAAQGKPKANSLWAWGAGTKPDLKSFKDKTGLRGAMISAVDLLKGIAVGTGMQVIHVPGATGVLDTNYEGKAEAAIKAVLEDGCDLAYIHVEAPDEMGHRGSATDKVLSIEYLDSRVIAPVVKAMDASGEDYRILIMPDHATPVRARTHTYDPVPYILFDSTCRRKGISHYSEREAKATGNFVPHAYELMDRLIKR